MKEMVEMSNEPIDENDFPAARTIQDQKARIATLETALEAADRLADWVELQLDYVLDPTEVGSLYDAYRTARTARAATKEPAG